LDNHYSGYPVISCPIIVSLQILQTRRSAEDSGRLFTKMPPTFTASECSLEVPLDIEENVSFAGVDSLEVGLLDTAVIEVEPGLVVGGKCSVVT